MLNFSIANGNYTINVTMYNATNTTGDFFDIPYTSKFDVTTITLETFVKHVEAAGHYGMVFARDSGGGSTRIWEMGADFG